MSYVADLHIHSRFSNACSKELNIPNLALWAKYKGIDLMGTGDFLHPLWRAELKRDLKEAGGNYEYQGIKFLPSVEVSCIYKQSGKVRRIHTLIILPSLESADNLAKALEKRGMNISSDGRPILGMSSIELCKIVFEVEPLAIIIPAHIWTPWFSLFGVESGYDIFDECFGEFSDQIFAVETGLSSEPLMNWRVSQLDEKSIVSFSDAHSLPRLGREVTVFDSDLSFNGLRDALRNQKVLETVEFFPEEGKYHLTGHRKCDVVYDQEQLKQNGETCPVCGRKLTLGVLNRVEELADRSSEDLRIEIEDLLIRTKALERPGFRMLVQLEEIIAESFGLSVNAKKVKKEYIRFVSGLDNEVNILTKLSIKEIEKFGGKRIAEGIERVREGRVSIMPGFDNSYGKVKIWSDEAKQTRQGALF